MYTRQPTHWNMAVVAAVRAYCPPSCVATKFRVVNRREANLGSHALAALAAQELALALGIGDLLREVAQARPEAVCVCGSTTAACANASCVRAAAASAAAVRFEAEKTARILALRSHILQGWLPRCLAADGNICAMLFTGHELSLERVLFPFTGVKTPGFG